MYDARREHDVEARFPKTGIVEIGLEEVHARDAEPARRLGAEPQRRPAEISSDHCAIGAREIDRHLPRAAADVDDPRVTRNRAIEQPHKRASLRARAQRMQRVALGIAGKRRALVELADGLSQKIA
jgi:K+-transporting ATPase c subunit